MADPQRAQSGPAAEPAEAAGEIRAAGVVLWQPGGPHAPGVQVALVHRPRYDDWSFAKGKLEPGEHVLRAAVREAAEETGLMVTLGRRLQPVRYSYRVSGAGTAPAMKRVDYWAATADDASQPFAASNEVDRLDWLSVAGARTRLSYPHDVELLDEFSAGPASTVPLIFLRHSSAGSRSEWPGEDEARPLDPVGSEDARKLAGLLRCFGVIPVVSSPTERCLATVRPYAQAAGVPVEADSALLVTGDARSGPATSEAAALAARLAAAGKPAVICAHRENIPLLLAAACAQLGGTPPAGPPLQKSEFLVLHTADGKLVASERHQAAGQLAGQTRDLARTVTRSGRRLVTRSGGLPGRLPVERGRQSALQDEEPALDLNARTAAVSAEAVAGQHAVARHDDRDGVRAHDLPDCAGWRNAIPGL
jgi:8-oxo-(d)GTP phosphatase